MAVSKPLMVTRSGWFAALPKFPPNSILLPSPELWLHHSASSGSDEITVKAIQAFHQASPPAGRGWNDIAYSFLVDNDAPDIDIFEGRGPGISGAHTGGHNTISHAICLIGNYDTSTPTAAALERIAHLVAYGYDQGWWPLGFTGGHRDVGSTSCPGGKLYALIDSINARARAIFAGQQEEAMPMYPIHRDTSLDGDGTRTSDTAYHAGLMNHAYSAALPLDGSWGPDMEALVLNQLGGNGRYITGSMAALLLKVHNGGTLPGGDWMWWRAQVDEELDVLGSFDDSILDL